MKSKGRVYYSLRVYHKTWTELNVLKEVWGGNIYQHFKNWAWVVGHKTTLKRIWDDLRAYRAANPVGSGVEAGADSTSISHWINHTSLPNQGSLDKSPSDKQ